MIPHGVAQFSWADVWVQVSSVDSDMLGQHLETSQKTLLLFANYSHSFVTNSIILVDTTNSIIKDNCMLQELLSYGTFALVWISNIHYPYHKSH
jgi:hypothetical protein